jgi:hypothetical protein
MRLAHPRIEPVALDRLDASQLDALTPLLESQAALLTVHSRL